MKDLLAPDVVNSFLDVVVRYLRSTVGIEAVVATVGEPEPMEPTIAVALDFKGDVRGPVTWVFPRPIALELVRRLMCEPDPSPEFATDGATELANILTGRASEVLERHGFQCEFGVPRLHVGDLPTGITVRMATANGPIDIVLSMAKTGRFKRVD
ncbi:MAG TPA: chemotaxis protein CheX [Kofleriaceae bacterium]|nr:chemotaxis protein CheX [Kofleriaceae bacterium]